MSTVLSAIPYSERTSGNAPNVAVSTQSTPAWKNSSCIWATRSGRVRTRCSLHPSSATPPKSSGPRSWPCMKVPNAPSKMSTRSRSASRNAWRAPLPTGVSAPRGSSITPGYVAVVLVGVGEQDQLDSDALRRAAATLAKRASKVAKVATTLLDVAPESLDRADAAQAIAEGVLLGSYQFLRYKGDARPTKLGRVL